MSTNIPVAWRFPAGRLREIQDIARSYMFARVIEWVEALMDSVKDEVIAQRMERYRREQTWVGQFSEADTERSIRCEIVLDLVRSARDEYGGSMLTLDCGLNIWLHEGDAYVIPWGQPQFYLDMEVPAWARDYSYQNSTDRPSSMSARAWSERRRTWDTVALDDWNAHRLAYKVIDMGRDGLGRSLIELHFLREARSHQQIEERE